MNCGRRLTLAAVLILALGLRLAWVLTRSGDPASLDALPDQNEYLQLGQNLLDGHGLQFTDPRFGQQVWAYRTPGYPLLIAACGGNVTAIRVAQAILDSASVLAIYLLARVWISPNLSLAAAFVVAVNPLLIYFTGLILSETFFISLLLWGMVLLVRQGPLPILGGIILAFGALTRPSAILLPTLLALIVKRRMALPVALLTLLTLFPWAYRNHLRLGTWIWTTTNSGITLYDGFNPHATGGSDQSFVRDMPQLSAMGEVERSQYLASQAHQYIRQNPWECLKLTGRKIVWLWSPLPQSPAYRSNLLYVAAGLAYSLPLLVLSVVGLAIKGLKWQAKCFLAAPALYFTLIHAASVASLRYRLPAEPIMSVLAVCGACGFWSASRKPPTGAHARSAD